MAPTSNCWICLESLKGPHPVSLDTYPLNTSIGVYIHLVQRGSSALECRTLKRESLGSNPLCYSFEVWAFSFSPRCPSSLSCVHEYLTRYSGGNVNDCSLHNICSMAESFLEKLSWCRNKHICQRLKCKALWAVQRTGFCAIYTIMPLPFLLLIHAKLWSSNSRLFIPQLEANIGCSCLSVILYWA